MENLLRKIWARVDLLTARHDAALMAGQMDVAHDLLIRLEELCLLEKSLLRIPGGDLDGDAD